MPAAHPSKSAFTLIELLVSVAIAAVLISLLLPALSSARESGRSAACLSNLRQCDIACRQYADENKGRSPAVGQPYSTWPNWALVIQANAGVAGTDATDLYSTRSVLICPSIQAHYGGGMQRTYAMNATGHSGQPASGGAPADPDNYDDAAHPAYIRMDSVQFPSATALLVDSAAPPSNTTDPPPPTRTASTLDFRQDDHVQHRLGWFHGRNRFFDGAMFDGSARVFGELPSAWQHPLP
jgi:prepilin-type N-terminal cleavage/methylation domain-containing protein